MRLANERTLELNITHQLLTMYSNSSAIGTTLQAEADIAVDSAIRTPYRIILFQYKAASAHKGHDGREGHFKINNNKWKDQHVKLHAIASVFPNMVFYAFPLVRTDQFFELNAANLIPYTVFIKAESLPSFATGSPHKVTAFDTGQFIAQSEKHEGNGLTGKQFLEELEEGKIGHEVPYGVMMDDLLRDSVERFMTKLESVCSEIKYQRRNLRIAFFHPTEPFLYSFRFGKRS